ncbi:unnamed protein product [Didymodactylos carnosus]|uniref:Integrator complex subunit 12 n=1 Tax=Didymodactylos carnosus TaxID=1234261 RepID=A0A815BRB3_9BILA|nr:unnamed protein product [Didymodactylos carnosus]CAF4058940.1 unnamed protein product [Didymodactylos carnosus]
MDIQTAHQLEYLQRSVQLLISQPSDVGDQLEKLIDELFSDNRQLTDKKKLFDSSSSSEKEKIEATTSDNSSDSSSSNSQISNKTTKQQPKRTSSPHNTIAKPARKRLKITDNNYAELTPIIVDTKLKIYTNETSEDEGGGPELKESLSAAGPVTTTTTNISLKDEQAITNTTNNRNIDEFAIEMGLVCNLCMVLTEEVDNKLVECHECHNKFHQKCHKPNVCTSQISDPRCQQQQQTNKDGKNGVPSTSLTKDPVTSKVKNTNSNLNNQSSTNGNQPSSSSVSGWAGLAANLKEKKQLSDSDTNGTSLTNLPQMTTPTTPTSSSLISLSDSTSNNVKDISSLTTTNSKRSQFNEILGPVKSPTPPITSSLLKSPSSSSNIINPLTKLTTTPSTTQLLKISSTNHSAPKNPTLKPQLSKQLDSSSTVIKTSNLLKTTSNNISKQIKRLSSPTPLGRTSLHNSNIKSPTTQRTTLNNNGYSRMNSTPSSSSSSTTTTQKQITASTVAKIQNSYNCDKRLKQMKKLAQESRLKK